MDVKEQVRRRRQDRMKQIREHSEAAPAMQPSAAAEYPAHAPFQEYSPYPAYSEQDRPPAYPLPTQNTVQPEDFRGMYDFRLQDPEYVWNHRHQLNPQASYRGGQAEERPFRFKPPSRKAIWVKLVLCALLFGCVWEVFHLDTPWAVQAQRYVSSALTKDFDFSAAAAWYESTFKGAPSFLPAFGDKKTDSSQKVSAPVSDGFTAPVQGKIITGADGKTDGVTLETQADAEVKAIGTGWVTFVGQKEGSGLTVVIQHADQYVSVYGQLSESLVQKNDWVQEGEKLGKVSKGSTASKGKLYFAVSHNNRFLDPADVVKFE